MRVDGLPTRTIRPTPQRDAVDVIDQRWLPHRLVIERLRDPAAVRRAIAQMRVRGAPLIGAAAAYGLALQARTDGRDDALRGGAAMLESARPTAVNLAWALRRMLEVVLAAPAAQRADAAWLATVDWGTATAPIYQAHAAGVAVEVWVDETRPRNQGASLTAWELGHEGVPHRVIADNAGGHLMQHGLVDLVIVGCDRVSARGDVCNKIGTYLKALAAHDCGVPFYVAMPTSTLDLTLADGLAEIPIEERPAHEVTHLSGRAGNGEVVEVQLVLYGTRAANPAFDVTPARLVTGLITEHGIVAADEGATRRLGQGRR